MKNNDDRSRGSISIEAIMVVTLLIIVLFVGIGTLFTLYVDAEMEWAMIDTASNVKVAFSIFAFENKDMEGEADFFADKTIELVCRRLLEAALNERKLDKLVNVDYFAGSQSAWDGTYYWRIKYKYVFPSVKRYNSIEFPLRAVVESDGLGFNSGTVFITRTGEKYHLSHCFHLAKSKVAMDYNIAIQKGYEACKNCHKEEKD